jgi:hypothetical protein
MLSKNFYLFITFISFYQITHDSFIDFGIIRSQEQPNLEPVKTFISRSKCKFESQYRLATPVQTLDSCYVIQSVPESAFSIVGLRPNTMSESEFSSGIFIVSTSNNSYANQLVISISSLISIYQVYSKDFSKFEPNAHMKT